MWSSCGSLYRVWQRKDSFDEIYERFIIGPVNRLSDKVLAVFDMKILDGLVNTVAGIVRLSGSLLRYTQTGIVTSYALFFVLGGSLVISLILFLRIQTRSEEHTSELQSRGHLL